jgi:hypothetical protein
MKRRTLLFLVAAAVGMLTAASTMFVAFADTTSITFEAPTYHTGNINGQDGWVFLSPVYDVAVDSSRGTTGFGAQSLRISNAFTSGSFGDWAFSKPLTNEAGEASATNGGLSGGTRQTHFEAKVSVASAVPNAEQPGLQVSYSPDRGDGARMSFIRVKDMSDGIHIFFDDYEDAAPQGVANGDPAGCGLEDDFVLTDIATLDRLVPHSIRLTMDFVNGPHNDVVKVYVDGVLKATGTSWEDYFRYCAEQSADNNTHTVDSLIFQARVGGGTAPGTMGNGFLFDNISLVSSNPPANAEACKSNGWQTKTRADNSVFKNQGDCIQYVNTGK